MPSPVYGDRTIPQGCHARVLQLAHRGIADLTLKFRSPSRPCLARFRKSVGVMRGYERTLATNRSTPSFDRLRFGLPDKVRPADQPRGAAHTEIQHWQQWPPESAASRARSNW